MGLFRKWLGWSSRDRFAAEVIRRLRAAGIRGAAYHRDEFAIEYRAVGDGDPARMYLSNLYAECQQDRGMRAARIDRFVATFVMLPTLPATWTEAKPLLRPVLRGASFGRGGPSRTPSVLRRPALPYLDELVVVDQPDSMGYVSDGMWGIPSQQIFAAARENMASQDEPSLAEVEPGGAVLRFVDLGDSYFVSRLLVPGWLGQLAEVVGGRPVAFAPDQATLVVAADDPQVLGPVFELVEREYLEATRALSPVGYTLDAGGRLVPYTVPSGHRLSNAVAQAERTLAAVEYEAQRGLLQSSVDADSYAVAGCLLGRRDDGGMFTVADWRQDLPTLLPAVDYVTFRRSDDQPLFVPWLAFVDEDLVEEAIEYRPPRYRIEASPCADVMDRLADRAVLP